MPLLLHQPAQMQSKTRRPRMISVIRLAGTSIAAAACRALISRGFKNSSFRTSPGCVLMRMTLSFVVIDDFDVGGPSIRPSETNPPAIINANAMLPKAIAFECFKPVARR